MNNVDEMKAHLEMVMATLRNIRGQIDEMRKLKKSDPDTWWHQYTFQRDLECLAEQEVGKYRKALWRAGVPGSEIDRMTAGWSAEDRYRELMKKKEA